VKITPVLFIKLEFHSTQAAKPLLNALNVLREMNEMPYPPRVMAKQVGILIEMIA
jgi:hypothetical protein